MVSVMHATTAMLKRASGNFFIFIFLEPVYNMRSCGYIDVKHLTLEPFLIWIWLCFLVHLIKQGGAVFNVMISSLLSQVTLRLLSLVN